MLRKKMDSGGAAALRPLSKRGGRILRKYINVAKEEGAKGVTLSIDGSITIQLRRPRAGDAHEARSHARAASKAATR